MVPLELLKDPFFRVVSCYITGARLAVEHPDFGKQLQCKKVFEVQKLTEGFFQCFQDVSVKYSDRIIVRSLKKILVDFS